MPIFVDGVEINSVFVDGVEQDKVFVDGVEVFTSFSLIEVGFWMGGGDNLANNVYSRIDAFDFPTETIENVTGILSQARETVAGISSDLKGYLAGGKNAAGSTFYNIIDSIQFADRFTDNLSATLSVARNDLGNVYSSITINGYWMGGFTVGFAVSNIIDGLDMANETALNPAITISPALSDTGGVSSDVRGYVGGGSQTLTFVVNTIQGIQFSNESYINPAATLSQARFAMQGIQDDIRGWWGGGQLQVIGPTWTNRIDGMTFSNEAARNPAATLSSSRGSTAPISSATRGYWGGGLSTGSASVNRIDGMIFSNETAVNPSASLPSITSSAGGTQAWPQIL